MEHGSDVPPDAPRRCVCTVLCCTAAVVVVVVFLVQAYKADAQFLDTWERIFKKTGKKGRVSMRVVRSGGCERFACGYE